MVVGGGVEFWFDYYNTVVGSIELVEGSDSFNEVNDTESVNDKKSSLFQSCQLVLKLLFYKKSLNVRLGDTNTLLEDFSDLLERNEQFRMELDKRDGADLERFLVIFKVYFECILSQVELKIEFLKIYCDKFVLEYGYHATQVPSLLQGGAELVDYIVSQKLNDEKNHRVWHGIELLSHCCTQEIDNHLLASETNINTIEHACVKLINEEKIYEEKIFSTKFGSNSSLLLGLAKTWLENNDNMPSTDALNGLIFMFDANYSNRELLYFLLSKLGDLIWDAIYHFLKTDVDQNENKVALYLLDRIVGLNFIRDDDEPWVSFVSLLKQLNALELNALKKSWNKQVLISKNQKPEKRSTLKKSKNQKQMNQPNLSVPLDDKWGLVAFKKALTHSNPLFKAFVLEEFFLKNKYTFAFDADFLFTFILSIENCQTMLQKHRDTFPEQYREMLKEYCALRNENVFHLLLENIKNCIGSVETIEAVLLLHLPTMKDLTTEPWDSKSIHILSECVDDLLLIKQEYPCYHGAVSRGLTLIGQVVATQPVGKSVDDFHTLDSLVSHVNISTFWFTEHDQSHLENKLIDIFVQETNVEKVMHLIIWVQTANKDFLETLLNHIIKKVMGAIDAEKLGRSPLMKTLLLQVIEESPHTNIIQKIVLENDVFVLTISQLAIANRGKIWSKLLNAMFLKFHSLKLPIPKTLEDALEPCLSGWVILHAHEQINIPTDLKSLWNQSKFSLNKSVVQNVLEQLLETMEKNKDDIYYPSAIGNCIVKLCDDHPKLVESAIICLDSIFLNEYYMEAMFKRELILNEKFRPMLKSIWRNRALNVEENSVIRLFIIEYLFSTFFVLNGDLISFFVEEMMQHLVYVKDDDETGQIIRMYILQFLDFRVEKFENWVFDFVKSMLELAPNFKTAYRREYVFEVVCMFATKLKDLTNAQEELEAISEYFIEYSLKDFYRDRLNRYHMETLLVTIGLSLPESFLPKLLMKMGKKLDIEEQMSYLFVSARVCYWIGKYHPQFDQDYSWHVALANASVPFIASLNTQARQSAQWIIRTICENPKANQFEKKTGEVFQYILKFTNEAKGSVRQWKRVEERFQMEGDPSQIHKSELTIKKRFGNHLIRFSFYEKSTLSCCNELMLTQSRMEEDNFSFVLTFNAIKPIPQKGIKVSKQKGIVVGSLVGKIPNQGGLTRTCDLLGMALLTLQDLRVQQEKFYQSIATSANHWMPLEQVFLENIPDYLIDLKQKGYRVVALEQTSNSTNIAHYTFPTDGKVAIVLGMEKEGTPLHILQLVDDCIEIPQLGLTRSLNVHASGSILMWEYTKQNYFNVLPE